MPTKISSNPQVSQAILDAMAAGRGTVKIASSEWNTIKRVALKELRNADSPKAEFKRIAKAFANMDKVLQGSTAERSEKFIEGELTRELKKQHHTPTTRTWSSYTGGSGGSHT
jgi:hypothetical protein